MRRRAISYANAAPSASSAKWSTISCITGGAAAADGLTVAKREGNAPLRDRRAARPRRRVAADVRGPAHRSRRRRLPRDRGFLARAGRRVSQRVEGAQRNGQGRLLGAGGGRQALPARRVEEAGYPGGARGA